MQITGGKMPLTASFGNTVIEGSCAVAYNEVPETAASACSRPVGFLSPLWNKPQTVPDLLMVVSFRIQQ